jgi:hypothetical protein
MTEMGSHIVNGQFQSDKYPTCPPGKVPLSVKDESAQDLLWDYAQRRRVVDAEFASDLEAALRAAGFKHEYPESNRCTPPYYRGMTDGSLVSREEMVRRLRAEAADWEHVEVVCKAFTSFADQVDKEVKDERTWPRSA